MAKLFLIGFMGCGKSTIGKQLASKLNYNFIDLDNFIEQENNLSINEIFENKGENEFRKIETNALKKIVSIPNSIVSCGGGTPCYYGNVDLMLNNGTVIYVKMSAKMLVNRLINAKNQRPLIQNKNKEELLEYVSAKLTEREIFYQKANYTVKGKNFDVNEFATFLADNI